MVSGRTGLGGVGPRRFRKIRLQGGSRYASEVDLTSLDTLPVVEVLLQKPEEPSTSKTGGTLGGSSHVGPGDDPRGAFLVFRC